MAELLRFASVLLMEMLHMNHLAAAPFRFAWMVLVLCVSVGLGGCVSDPFNGRRPEPRPLGSRLEAYEAPRDADQINAAQRTLARPTGTLTLREALAQALAHNPEFAAASWQIRIREAEALQAGLPPNPELETEFADFGGTGEADGFDALETTVSVIQLIELGGDREKRLAQARLHGDLAGWDYEAKRLAVISETRRRFLDAVVAERRLRLLREKSQLASRQQDEPEERTPASLDAVDERLEQFSEKMELRQAEQQLQHTYRALAAMWGTEIVGFEQVAGDLGPAELLPKLETLMDHLNEHPQLARYRDEFARHRIAAELADAQAVPDIEAQLGGVHSRESDDWALELGFTLPLPLFDRKQGDKLAARLERVKASHQRQATHLRLQQQLRQAHAALGLAADEVRFLTDEVLPVAEAAASSMENDFEQGLASQSDVVDAKRKLLEVRQLRLDALASYHNKVIDVEELIVRPLHTPPDRGDRERDEEKRGTTRLHWKTPA